MAALCGALAIRGDARHSYADGLAARDAGRWSEAALHMAAAIAERSAEGEQYLPYYFIGLAHAELGNCAAALAAWGESERQGVVQTVPALHRTLRERFIICSARLAAARPTEAIAGVPPILIEGTAAYFDGDYERATALLSAIVLTDSKLAAQQHLFLAASTHARYVLDGSADQALEGRAAAAVRRCRRFDSALVPRADVFSPRFITFFNETR